jgi:imidazolonepropionase-like amidohydrolase
MKRQAVALFALMTTIPAAQAAADTVALRDVVVVDVKAGTLRPGMDVLVGDGLIAAVEPTGPEPPEADRVLEAGGQYLIPGLWDAHVHVFSDPAEAATALPLHLLHGVTGIRDMGALVPVEEQHALAEAIERGEVLGPRLVVSGAWVDAPPGSWPGMFLAATPEEARAVVERIDAEGWAAVKAYSMLAPDTYRALARAAEGAGLPLVGHVPETVTLAEAIEAGQDGMEHWGRVTMACALGEAAMVAEMREAMAADDPRAAMIARMAAHEVATVEGWDEATCEAALATLAEAGVHVTPTLVVADFYVGERPDPDAPRMRTLPAPVRAAWEEGSDFRLEAMTDELRALADRSLALDRRTFAMAAEAGVPIVAGTDASFANPWLFHGASLPDELGRYVEAGMTPREALATATVTPPRFLGLPDQDGAIAPGRRADLVLLGANPLEDIAAVSDVEAVVVNGRLLDRAALDALAAELEAAAQ